MRIQIVSIISVLFLAISSVFLALSFGDMVKNGMGMTIARKVWLRMALIFAAVATGLYVLHGFL